MKRTLQAAALGLLAIGAMPALAQTESVARSGNTPVSPRDPGVSTAQTPASQGRIDQTVQGIDQKLLNQEKDRPRIPGQVPSPSQTKPGGTAAGQKPGTPP